MDFSYLYTSFDGRINRKPFWMAVLIMIAATIVISIVVALLLGTQARSFAIFSFLLQLALLYPSLALMIKRLHDRNRPDYFAYIMVAPSVLTGALMAFGLAGDPLAPNALYYVLQIVSFAVGIWAFIDLGCLRGTVGPNNYGPDPLQMQQPMRV
ncbi:MAG: DUF805 domain-containing protein [Variibacter sp.]|nr:DUF805 domain-containing protein [Variibacter sp.]